MIKWYPKRAVGPKCQSECISPSLAFNCFPKLPAGGARVSKSMNFPFPWLLLWGISVNSLPLLPVSSAHNPYMAPPYWIITREQEASLTHILYLLKCVKYKCRIKETCINYRTVLRKRGKNPITSKPSRNTQLPPLGKRGMKKFSKNL